MKMEFDESRTDQLLNTAHQAYNTEPIDTLMTALCQSLADWTKESKSLVALYTQDRRQIFPHLECSRTVGDFETIRPVVVNLENNSDAASSIIAVKETLRTPTPGDFAHLVFRQGAPGLESLDQADVGFSFHQPLRATNQDEENLILTEGSLCQREINDHYMPHRLNVTFQFEDSKLVCFLDYDGGRFNEETMNIFGRNLLGRLGALVDHCQGSEAGAFTPSDFPEANLEHQDLDDIYRQLADLDF